ncbi:class I SAM-dependent methyltransferase [Fluviibacterium sp. DFM31]|uniref:Class I SAM-dependent methyltransferase n=1 Tax=Meridianimarinicoccus marinus TaxID=3231483 RepID=A0ABV3L3I9_9RHOB
MSGFDPVWLALREPADRAARDAGLIERAAAGLRGHMAAQICDIGAGAGAALRAFSPVFPKSCRWTFVDNDAEVLAAARQACGPEVALRQVDLSLEPAPWPEDCALVTATAFFDLAGAGWVDRFAAALARDRLPLLACLTYDGVMRFAPAHPLDAAITSAFNRHQQTDKGLGGAALGPKATPYLVAALQGRGYRCRTALTPWRLTPAHHGRLIETLVTGIAGAAAEIGDITAAQAEAWAEDRNARLSELQVGHLDLYAVPPAS